jgi:Putative Ig domain
MDPGGAGPHRWRIVSGALPQGMKLDEVSGILEGSPEETGQSEFTILLSDNIQSIKKQYTLKIETPLTVEWDQKSRVDGNRIDGSVKVSNQTGRDFDLTFIVLAVNDIGRATAIGYQHFPLKKNTRDLQLPFGDTLSSGDYNVHVDVVAEEPISNRIFRARLVSGKQSVAQSP